MFSSSILSTQTLDLIPKQNFSVSQSIRYLCCEADRHFHLTLMSPQFSSVFSWCCSRPGRSWTRSVKCSCWTTADLLAQVNLHLRLNWRCWSMNGNTELLEHIIFCHFDWVVTSTGLGGYIGNSCIRLVCNKCKELIKYTL